MPLPILLTAFASALAGDPLVGGKLLAASLMAILLALDRGHAAPLLVSVDCGRGARRRGDRTDAGLQAGTSIGGDSYRSCCKCGAWRWRRSPSVRMLIAAGGLAGLGVASKLTGLWAFFAITTWSVLQHQWRRAAIFAASCVATAAAILGRCSCSRRAASRNTCWRFRSPVSMAARSLRGPNQVLYNLLGFAAGTVVLFPLAVVGVLLSRDWRQVSVIHLALGYALVLLLVVTRTWVPAPTSCST